MGGCSVEFDPTEVEVKVLLVHVMKAYAESKVISPSILNLGTRWR
jgi:hypothetical protein